MPDTDHGMGVYGIIAALTNNNEDVAGIAPNTRQIVMERPSLTSVNYPDVLLWAAGFTTGNASGGWPAEPLANGADIISASVGRFHDAGTSPGNHHQLVFFRILGNQRGQLPRLCGNWPR